MHPHPQNHRLVSKWTQELCDAVAVHAAAPKGSPAQLSRFPALRHAHLKWGRAADAEQLAQALGRLRQLQSITARSRATAEAACEALLQVPAAAAALTRLELW